MSFLLLYKLEDFVWNDIQQGAAKFYLGKKVLTVVTRFFQFGLFCRNIMGI